MREGFTTAAVNQLAAVDQALARVGVGEVRKETRITFSRWKQQARLLEAVKRLSGGAAVTDVALDLGYQSPDAFFTMCRRMLVETPSAYSRH